jgi:hypothetical protein
MVNPAPRRITFVGKAGVDYACVRRLSDGTEWELSLAAYAALSLPGAGAPPNVSGGALSDAEWLTAWQSNQLMAYQDWAWNTPTKRLEFADVGIGPDEKLRIGLGNGRVFTMWPSNRAEAQASGITWTGNNVNNITLVTTRTDLPFTLELGILSLK